MTNKATFLKDVLICSLGAYGGPEAHYGVFTEQLVIKKKYLTEELVELIALTGILPGILLLSKKIPAFLIVIATILLGIGI